MHSSLSVATAEAWRSARRSLSNFAQRLLKGASAQLDLPIVNLKTIAFHRLWPLAVSSAILHGRLMDRLGF